MDNNDPPEIFLNEYNDAIRSWNPELIAPESKAKKFRQHLPNIYKTYSLIFPDFLCPALFVRIILV